MKRIVLGVVISVLLVSPLIAQLHACSLCQGMTQRGTLGMEYERAQLVLYGQISNPRFANQAGAAPGSGSTDLRVEKVLKDTSNRGPWKDVVLPRYLPVLDAQNAPQTW